MNIEQRYSSTLSIRQEGDKTILSGLAVPYFDGSPGTEYELAPGYFERFATGSFSNLADEITANLQHDRHKILGVTPDTLQLRETARGLEYDVTLTDDSYSRDAKSLVAARKLKGSSIGFIPDKIEQKRDGNKNIVFVRQATLDHIAIVTQPAYKSTEAYLRELQDTNEKMLTAMYEERMDKLLDSLKRLQVARK